GLGSSLQVKIQVIRHEKIKKPVAIVIHKRASSAPTSTRFTQSRARRHIGEGTVAIIVIEHVLPPVSHEQVDVSVVIVITRAYSLSPTRVNQPCLPRDIGERAIMIVAVKMIRGL